MKVGDVSPHQLVVNRAGINFAFLATSAVSHVALNLQ